MYSHQDLVDSLSVEMIDEFLFSGSPLQMALPRIYGGQILGQALAAAMLTVEDGEDAKRRPHSMHAYFLRPGDMSRNVIFDVDPIRDGRSFTTRRVVAKQRGRAIFNASVSFQKIEDGVEHQMDMPDGIPGPEALPEALEQSRRLARDHGLSEDVLAGREANFPSAVIDIRTPFPERLLVAGDYPPSYGYWFRFTADIPSDPILHRALLAFISDHALMATALVANGVNWISHDIMGASLDHAMWFHTDVRVDQWLYYHIESPRSARARGLNIGRFYTREGRLIATTAQEGLMRVNGPRKGRGDA